MEQRVVVLAGPQNHVAAAPAVAAAGAAPRNVLLPPERETAIAAIARLDSDYGFIDKCRHASKQQWPRVRRPRPPDPSAAALSLFRANADELAHPPAIAKHHHAGDAGVQRVVLAAAHVLARLVHRAALPNQNGPARHQLAAERLHAQPPPPRIAPAL